MNGGKKINQAGNAEKKSRCCVEYRLFPFSVLLWHIRGFVASTSWFYLCFHVRSHFSGGSCKSGCQGSIFFPPFLRLLFTSDCTSVASSSLSSARWKRVRYSLESTRQPLQSCWKEVGE